MRACSANEIVLTRHRADGATARWPRRSRRFRRARDLRGARRARPFAAPARSEARGPRPARARARPAGGRRRSERARRAPPSRAGRCGRRGQVARFPRTRRAPGASGRDCFLINHSSVAWRPVTPNCSVSRRSSRVSRSSTGRNSFARDGASLVATLIISYTNDNSSGRRPSTPGRGRPTRKEGGGYDRCAADSVLRSGSSL